MKLLGTKSISVAAMTSIAISMVACQQAPRSKAAATVRQNVSVTSLPAAGLEAAAEPFEALTEQAFSASPKEFEALISKAKSSYRSVEHVLAPSQRAEADQYFKVLTTADQKANRSKIALASVEIYRLLLEAQNRARDPIIRAGLLDYAGFRYGALAQSDSVDWAEMSRTTRSAQFEWHKLEPSIGDKALREQFSASLNGMLDAASKRNPSSARKAAAAELQLVDLLENQISAKSA